VDRKRVFRGPSKALAIFLLLMIVIVAPSIRHRTAAEKAAISQTMPGDLEARNKNAFALILGEIRATAADLMFIKTERYIHGGIAYRPHLNMNRIATTGEVTAVTPSNKDHHEETEPILSVDTHGGEPHEIAPAEDHGHHEPGQCPGGVPTLIRTASQDFRGFLGKLERETKPFQDPKLPHHHGRKDELLPWYRLMTLTDPQNLRGYMIGTMLLRFANRPDEALSFIREGIEKNHGNPQAFRLYASLTQIHWKSGRLEKALDAARTGYEMGKPVRPEGGEAGAVRKGVKWTDDLENDFMFVARFYPLLLERKGEEDEALRLTEEVASLAPDDAWAWRYLGGAYRKQGKLDEAVAAFTRALGISPNSTVACNNLGLVYLEQDKPDEAIRAFKNALAIKPDDADSFHNLALAYHQKGDHASAWKCVHKCQALGGKLDPDFLDELRGKMKEPGK